MTNLPDHLTKGPGYYKDESFWAPGYDPEADNWLTNQPWYNDPDRFEGIEEDEELSDLSGLPFKFNPPLHRLSQPVYLNQPNEQQTQERWFREATSEKVFSEKLRDLKALRLGRITMGNEGWGYNDTSEGFRYGFRFLYNPDSLSASQTVGSAILPNPQDKAMYYNLDGMEQWQIPLVLNRIPDVMRPHTALSDYTPSITDKDLRQLRRRGTNYDLESLFRVANGQQMRTIDNQLTADFGFLSPNPCVLTIGRQQYLGRMTGIQTSHEIFSPAMVPVLSRVTLGFMRTAAITSEELADLASSGGRALGRPEDFLEILDSGGGQGDSPDTGQFDPGAVHPPRKEGEPYNQTMADTIARMIVRTAMVSNELGGGGDRGRRAALIGLIAAAVESEIQNLAYGDRDSVGVFQQRAAGWGTYAERTNVQKAIDAFFGLRSATHASAPGLVDLNSWWLMEPGRAAQAVQVSAFPLRYAERIDTMTILRNKILREEGYQ